MKLTEAYKRLGYTLDNHQTDWSAAKPDGIAIAIWQREMGVHDRLPYFDTRSIPVAPETDIRIGHAKRLKHLERARDEFDGRLDVILLSGIPSEGAYRSADPWQVQSRGGFWKLKEFDPTTGHFRVEVVATPKASATKGE
jgi:hypothetical protein